MDSAIMAANDKLDTVMQDEQTRRHYWKREMARRDQRGQLAFARDEGLAEGRAEGLAEGKLEIARKMKNRGRPLTEIAEITGLTLEAIEQL